MAPAPDQPSALRPPRRVGVRQGPRRSRAPPARAVQAVGRGPPARAARGRRHRAVRACFRRLDTAARRLVRAAARHHRALGLHDKPHARRAQLGRQGPAARRLGRAPARARRARPGRCVDRVRARSTRGPGCPPAPRRMASKLRRRDGRLAARRRARRGRAGRGRPMVGTHPHPRGAQRRHGAVAVRVANAGGRALPLALARRDPKDAALPWHRGPTGRQRLGVARRPPLRGARAARPHGLGRGGDGLPVPCRGVP